MYGLLIKGCKQAKYIPYARSILGFLMRNNAGNILIFLRKYHKGFGENKNLKFVQCITVKMGKKEVQPGASFVKSSLEFSVVKLGHVDSRMINLQQKMREKKKASQERTLQPLFRRRNAFQQFILNLIDKY